MTIIETYNPGSLVKISLKEPVNGSWVPVWEGFPKPDTERKARIFEPPLKKVYFGTRNIRLDFDTRLAYSWSEIDAVQACGWAFY